MKRTISFLLTLVLLLSLFPIAPAKAAAIKYAVSGGNITMTESGMIYACDKTVTEAIIPPTIEGIQVKSIAERAFRGCSQLKRVVLPEGLTTISSYAFQDCGNLEVVELPSTVTELKGECFASCGLKTIDLKYVEAIYSKCFYNCRKLSSVSFDRVEMIYGEAFRNCYALSSVSFPNTLRHIAAKAFYDTAIRSIVLPASVGYIAPEAFSCNLDLTSITLLNPGCRLGDVSMDTSYNFEVFSGKVGRKLNFHGEENSSLRAYAERTGNNFTAHKFNEDERCTVCGAEPFALDDGCWSFDSRSGTAYIYGCGETANHIAVDGHGYYDWDYYRYYIKHLVFADHVRQIPNDGFSNLTALETVNLYTIEKIGRYAFKNCTAFERFYSGDTLKTIGLGAFQDCTALIQAVLRPSVEYLGAGAFGGCTSLNGTVILNPKCQIGGYHGNAKLNVIYGFIPSTAYDYATEYQHPFVELNGCEYDIHDYEVLSETPATCEAEGERVYLCKNCKEKGYTEAIPATGHSYEAVVTEATCTEAGFTTHRCANCADSYITDEAPAMGHNYEIILQEPTCTEGGWTDYSCSRCGDAYKSDFIEPTGHSYTSQTMPATCTAGGHTDYFCVNCSHAYTADYTEPLGHSYSAVTTLAPTCTEGGYTEYLCAACGEQYRGDDTSALGHSYKNGACRVCGEADPDFKPVEIHFDDVSAGSWYMSAVEYAVRNKLMYGTGHNCFEPETATNRAMLVTVLWRYVGEPLDGKNHFRDVPMGQWFTDAVAWASYRGIVAGTGNGYFDPEGNITREQLVAILYRYCNSVGIDTGKRADLTVFPDSGKVSAYASDALAWAVSEGLVSGTKIGNTTYLDPQGNATRAQVAAILMRFIEGIEQ